MADPSSIVVAMRLDKEKEIAGWVGQMVSDGLALGSDSVRHGISSSQTNRRIYELTTGLSIE
jgi:hypothetical protein